MGSLNSPRIAALDTYTAYPNVGEPTVVDKQLATAASKTKPEAIVHRALVPEPMKIILQRAQSIELMPLPYRVPEQSPELIEEAAQAFAAFNNSDPFAYQRMKIHLQRGLETASQIAPEYRSKLRARQLAATFKRQDANLMLNEYMAS